jgi:FG-GAP repeat protein
VGADGHGESTANAYVYVKGVSGWPSSPTVSLHDPSGVASSDFGRSVSVAGNTIAVGSDFGLGGGGGVTYLYVRGATGWPSIPTVTLNDPGATNDDLFGHSVALSDTALVVGAPGTDSGAGTEYVYVESGGAWPTTPTVISPNPAPTVSSGYGSSVAISGNRVAVGADGAVAIEYKSPSGNPTNIQRILFDPSGIAAGAGDQFGNTVAITGTTVVVGTEASVAYLYVKGASSWPTSPTTTLPDPPGGFPQDNFGISMAASPSAIVIGDNASGPNGGGQAYVYTAIDGTWLSEPTATLSDPVSGSAGLADEFGKAVAVAGTTVLVGAPGTSSDTGHVGTGVAYLYAG